MVTNNQPPNDLVNSTKTDTTGQSASLPDHPMEHETAAESGKWDVCHLSGWDPHVSTKWERYLSAEASLSHSSSHLHHSLSLLTQEQARTLETREGRDWRKNWTRWRKGRRGALATAHGHPPPLNPFMVSSRGTIFVSWILHPMV